MYKENIFKEVTEEGSESLSYHRIKTKQNKTFMLRTTRVQITCPWKDWIIALNHGSLSLKLTLV